MKNKLSKSLKPSLGNNDIEFEQITLAQSRDLEAIMQLFDACRRYMIEQGIMQWDERYPVREVVAKDIEAETVFVVREEDKVVGTITLNEDQAAAYQAIQWAYERERILVIHRLAIHPHIQGKSYGKKMCLFAEHWAQQQEYALIRLDSYSDNAAANHLYRSLDYQLAEGLCYFHGNALPFYCYEKLVSPK